jgi:hypothetical protein
MRTLYVSDLDGTLLDRDQRVSEQTATIINDTPLRRNVLPPDLALDLIRDQLAGGLNPFVYTLDAAGRYHAYYLGASNACERDYVDRRLAAGDDRFAVVPDLAEAIDGDVLSLSTIELPNRMAALHRRLSTNPLLCCHFDHDIYMRAFHWLTIGHADGNKGAGVRIVKEMVGADRVVCFGDNLNDRAMFEVADEAYAMAGAHDGLRDIAHGMIGSNADHAVAAYLRDAWPAPV